MVVIWEDMYAYSIWPVVSILPWFKQDHGKSFMALGRGRYRGKSQCIFSRSRDYETVDHVLWGCEQFLMDLRSIDTEWRTPIRDIIKIAVLY
jgi:hypothetical protein